jgi:serine/threonine protein kinase
MDSSIAISKRQAAKLAERITKKAPDLCRRIRLTPVSPFLGNGIHGSVFEVPNRAVKVTGSAVEAEVARALIGRRLTNVVKVYSVTQVSSRRWVIVMERLVRHGMGRLAQHHPDSYAGATQLYRMGYVHIDLHDSNVMLCPKTRRLKVIDFGLVKRLKGR